MSKNQITLEEVRSLNGKPKQHYLSAFFLSEHVSKATAQQQGYLEHPEVYQAFPILDDEDGDLYFSRNENISEDDTIKEYSKFVVTGLLKPDGTIIKPTFYLCQEFSPEHGLPFVRNHSDFVHGEPVLFSGYINFDCFGRVTQVTNESGHYKIDFESSLYILTQLITQDFLPSGIIFIDYSQADIKEYQLGDAIFQPVIAQQFNFDDEDDDSDYARTLDEKNDSSYDETLSSEESISSEENDLTDEEIVSIISFKKRGFLCNSDKNKSRFNGLPNNEATQDDIMIASGSNLFGIPRANMLIKNSIKLGFFRCVSTELNAELLEQSLCRPQIGFFNPQKVERRLSTPDKDFSLERAKEFLSELKIPAIKL